MSDQCDALSASIPALSQILVGDSTLEETLRRVADLATKTISGSDMVSVARLVEGRPRTVAFTDVTAPEIDDAQYHTGIGPCLDALGCQQVQRVDSTDNDERWPPFAEAEVVHGILSSLSLPLTGRHAAIGALNCYSRRPAAFSVDDERIGSRFAAAAAVAVAKAQAYWDARDLSERLLGDQDALGLFDRGRDCIAGPRCWPPHRFERTGPTKELTRAAHRACGSPIGRPEPASRTLGRRRSFCGVRQQRTGADHAVDAVWPASLLPPALPADPAHPDRVGRDRP